MHVNPTPVQGGQYSMLVLYMVHQPPKNAPPSVLGFQNCPKFCKSGTQSVEVRLVLGGTRNLVLPNQIAQVHKQLVEDVRPNFY